jgi:hypothetical protein
LVRRFGCRIGAVSGALVVGLAGVSPAAFAEVPGEIPPCTQEFVQPVVLAGTPDTDIVEPGTVLTGVAAGYDVGVQGQIVSYFTWFKDGQPVLAGSPKLKVGRADLGSTIVGVVATRPKPGTSCTPFVGATQAWKVLAKPKVTARTVKKSVAAAERAVVAVSVVADGVARPIGKVTVAVDGKKALRKTVWLNPDDKGTREVKLPKLARGTHTVTATFKDLIGKTQDGTAKKLKLKIT